MSTPKPTHTKNLDIYDAPTIDWSAVQHRIDEGITQGPNAGGPNRHTAWLGTTNPDGTPHVVPFGVMFDEGNAYVVSGPGTRKSKNMERDPHVTVSVSTDPFDLSIEGRATRITDDQKLQRIAKLYHQWGPEARDGAFWHDYSAPSAGPPPWYVYEIVPATVFAFGASEGSPGATRFDF